METSDTKKDWTQKDITIPLLLSGLFTTVVCISFCAYIYLTRETKPDGLLPFLGLVDATPTPVPCPSVPEDWALVMNYDFKNLKRGWPEKKESNEYATANLQVKNDSLEFQVTSKRNVFSNRYPYQDSVKDFHLSSLVRKAKGPETVKYGITSRINGRQVLFFNITDSGIFEVQARDTQNKWQNDLLQGYSPYIKAGEYNKLEVIGRGDYYTFCINGYVAGNANSNSYSSGKVGIGIEINEGGFQATIEFDDFMIYAPKE